MSFNLTPYNIVMRCVLVSRCFKLLRVGSRAQFGVSLSATASARSVPGTRSAVPYQF